MFDSKLNILSSNKKLDVGLAFQKYQSTGNQSFVEIILQLEAVVKQKIGIAMGIDPGSYWAKRFLYFFESNYVLQLTSKKSPCANKFDGTSRFIDNLCIVNDYGEVSSS